tara:strand:- start:81303 stop:81512 length:210 start_codon:yes stop_codon:yes gene_type:complete
MSLFEKVTHHDIEEWFTNWKDPAEMCRCGYSLYDHTMQSHFHAWYSAEILSDEQFNENMSENMNAKSNK